MQIFDQLKKDHQDIRQLFAKIEKTSKKQERLDLFEKLNEMLIAHAHAEEKVFYPALKSKSATKDEIKHAIDEHHEAERMLKTIQKMDDPSKKEWMEAIEKLRDSVEEHVQEEEQQIFSHARQEIADDKLESMTSEFIEVKQQEMGGSPG
ncbi:MAG: hemerythrin domain-containing protein [Alphaproteobacteria bacterium]|nr:hemerythrin domain-containing protein [Alphaproteobacteria bacterium]MBF0373569.1 hemerythrin domain-containing protein [Alphaproteobacteria bacterium]